MYINQEYMQPYFTAIENCQSTIQMEKHHPEGSVFNHSLQVLQWALRESTDIDLILAAMLHDIGKVQNALGHEQIAIEIIGDYISAKTKWLIEQHMRIWYLILGDMKKLLKIRTLLDHPLLPDPVALARWDKLGRNPKYIVKYDKELIIKKLNICAEKQFTFNEL